MECNILGVCKRDDGYEFNLKVIETLASIELLEEAVADTCKLVQTLEKEQRSLLEDKDDKGSEK